MHYRRPSPAQTGFSLIEIMVAMAIGLLTSLVIMQVFSAFEGQKRATTGTADAQTNGSVALYTIGRDLQMAGFGLLPTSDPVNVSPLECNPLPTWDDDNNIATARITLDLSPVIITDGGAGAGATDSISVVYGTNPMGGIPTVISAIVGTTATVDNNLGCRVGDMALAISGSNCAAARVTGPTDIAIPPVATIPPDITHIALQDVVGIVAGANLACLGTWNRTVYSVNNGNLEVNGVPRIAGIVNLQAQYGISATANNNTITQWVNASAAPWNIVPLAIADRNRIKAVRLAIVARNGSPEKEIVSTACDSLTAAAPTGLCAWAGSLASPAPSINLTNDANWANYRYRVFETIIPLRNVIWSKATL